MMLLLDIGNSRLKWATLCEGRIQFGAALDYRQADYFSQLQQSWRKLETPQKIVIASVAARQCLSEIMDSARQMWPDAEQLLAQSSGSACGVTNAYRQPEKLGVDRWLALLATHQYYPGQVCVVDCGTAITVDLIAADGQHLGGLICPGLTLMKQSLAANAAALPFSELPQTVELASATDAAIANGVLMAAVGLIESVLLRHDSQLLLTGGDAALIAHYLRNPFIVDNDLVFKGLALVGKSPI